MSTPDPEKLKELENRIARIRAANAPKPAKEEHHTMANMAWRMVIELVAGIAIGFGIGFGLDWLFGTMPIFLILFIGLGLAAGIRTMMRTAEEVQKMHMAHAADDTKGEDLGNRNKRRSRSGPRISPNGSISSHAIVWR